MPREHTTNYLLSKFLHFGVLLMNQKHLPAVVKDKRKILAFGSENIMNYLEECLKSDEGLKEGFKKDQKKMNETTDRDYHPVAPENAYNTVVANLGHLYYHFL